MGRWGIDSPGGNRRISALSAAKVFANTHTELCNSPTRVGEMHAGLKGRDALGDLIGELHAREIDVVIYQDVGIYYRVEWV